MAFSHSALLVASCLFFSTLVIISKADDDHGSASISYDADSFKAGIDANRNFVMFFAPWCGHCKNLAPTWNELAKIYNKDDDGPVTIAKVDCTEETALCADHEITGFPTLKLFEKGGKTFKRYSGKRDLEALKNFVQEQVVGKEEQAEAGNTFAEEKEESLITLNDENFEATIATGAFFVKFYAPWCGHCKKLAPTWDELAETFTKYKGVSIAKIDCTRSTVICKQYEVRGYPTLLWFQDGKKIAKYQGSRSHDALKEYTLTQLEAAGEEKNTLESEEDVKSGVEDLTEENFKSFLSSRLVFVKFFAPWCGHCKRLAPTWEELAGKVKNDEVTIAKVDCTQHKSVCDENQVRGYPTLKIFRNGEFVADYKGSRSLEDLQQFVKKSLDLRDEL
ncbi:thioredoxin/protein disulfide isomerase [Elysia marginata]|uniref:Thioredoxin/protein disulfide isomerase n=1 Tax=Elysia marginata TaxID=1093978 RepID=A0AAV4IPX1_9GAST|nr:thioredoxin/protein disulfide isomerase [Elysia marginata]